MKYSDISLSFPPFFYLSISVFLCYFLYHSLSLPFYFYLSPLLSLSAFLLCRIPFSQQLANARAAFVNVSRRVNTM